MTENKTIKALIIPTSEPYLAIFADNVAFPLAYADILAKAYAEKEKIAIFFLNPTLPDSTKQVEINELCQIGCIAEIKSTASTGKKEIGVITELSPLFQRVKIPKDVVNTAIPLIMSVEIITEDENEEIKAQGKRDIAELHRLFTEMASLDKDRFSGDYSKIQALRLVAPLMFTSAILNLLTPDEKTGKKLNQAKQEFLEEIDSDSRLAKALEILKTEVKNLRNLYSDSCDSGCPNQQTWNDDAKEFWATLKKGDYPNDVRVALEKKITKLGKMTSNAHEFPAMRDWIEKVINFPWFKSTEDNIDLKSATEILDRDHYGLKLVKDFVLEMLAVKKLNPDFIANMIVCFDGPPGTGKTSIGRAIARAMGRKCIRISLGGLKDETEIKGHNRTYLGSQPGKIVRELIKSGVNNPVFMLDEIDKIGSDFKGDPSSALLEALDPEQNHEFGDNYLGELRVNLSGCLFICTSNEKNKIPLPLLDRMEIVNFPGYSFYEKGEIAKKHTIPKCLKKFGLEGILSFPDLILQKMILEYSHGLGMRRTEQLLEACCRKIARKIAEGNSRDNREISEKDLQIFFENPIKRITAPVDPIAGQIPGLYYSLAGGGILLVEASATPGKGGLITTGKLGDVMKESARAALTFTRANYKKFGIPEKYFDTHDIHVHVPAGAIPKDGPSAGTAIAIAIISECTEKIIKEKMAMSGEITTKGQVLPIGGIKEKYEGAALAGIKTIILPEKNRADFKKAVDKGTLNRFNLNVEFVSNVQEILELVM